MPHSAIRSVGKLDRLSRLYGPTPTPHGKRALWHERDISHSAVERVIFPDSFILTDYA